MTDEQLDYYGDMFQGHVLQKQGWTFEAFLALASYRPKHYIPTPMDLEIDWIAGYDKL